MEIVIFVLLEILDIVLSAISYRDFLRLAKDDPKVIELRGKASMLMIAVALSGLAFLAAWIFYREELRAIGLASIFVTSLILTIFLYRLVQKAKKA